MMRQQLWSWQRLLVGALLVLWALGAQAATENAAPLQRFALIVGANDGGPGRDRLHYAASDAQSMARVLVQLGGVRTADFSLLVDPSPAALHLALEQLSSRIIATRQKGQRSELVFYYSGHSDEVGLLLGNQRLDYRALRTAIGSTAADVTIAILDSCSAGAFTRQKGGVHQQPFLVDSSVRVSGHAFLASSSENEAAQESDRIGSSFFTYYLLTGLRGAADVSGDGRVTLNEAYNFAFNETLARTERTLGGAQHPEYEIQLAGTGDVVLTDLHEPSARLELARELAGRVYIRTATGALLAELTKHAGSNTIFALEPGAYRVAVERDGRFFESQLTLVAGQTTQLGSGALQPVAGERTVSRGGPEEPVWVPANLSIIPTLSINRLYGPRVLNNFSFNLLIGKATALRGLEIGLLASSRTEDSLGLQLSGIANVVGRTQIGGQLTSGVNIVGRSAIGLQFAGVANIVGGQAAGVMISSALNLVGGESSGFHLSGFDLVRGSFHGAQLAGVAAVTLGEMTGMQLSSFFAQSAQVSGVQIAMINIAGDVTGAQLGIINVARSVHGAQLGMINIARDVSGASIGFLSFIQNGTHTLELYGSDLMPLNLETKLGSRRAYGIFSAGIDPFHDSVRWSFGAGLGIHFLLPHSFFFDLDLLVQGLQPDIRHYDIYHRIYPELRLLVGYQVAPGFALFVGPTFHVSASDDPCCGGQLSRFDGGERLWQSGSYNIRFGPGLSGGIRAF